VTTECPGIEDYILGDTDGLAPCERDEQRTVDGFVLQAAITESMPTA
jgi:hypothetical protein